MTTSERDPRPPTPTAGFRSIAVALVAGVALGTVAFMATSPQADGARFGDERVEVAGRSIARHGDVPDAVLDAAQSSVVQVTVRACGVTRTASATRVLTGEGRELLLTNAHVVTGSTEAVLAMPDGSERTVVVLGAINGVDAALLASPDPVGAGPSTVPGLPLGPPAAIGDAVVVAGHPAGEARLDATTVVSSEVRIAPGGMARVFLTVAGVHGGHSGGAVLDRDGRVVGLVVARDPVTGGGVAHPIDEVLAGPLVATPGC